jgi:protein-lysine N-methyltransferase EEF2KMT
VYYLRYTLYYLIYTILNYTLYRLWAPYWYSSTHQSTGFYEGSTLSQNNNNNKSPYAHYQEHYELVEEAMPFYQLLQRKAIGHQRLNPGSSHFTMDWSTTTTTTPPTTTSTTLPSTTVSSILTTTTTTKPAVVLGDPRNETIYIWIGSQLYPRSQAKISVLDSSVQGGDAVWEGLRIYNHHIFKLNEHLQRLFDSAKALDFHHIPSYDYIYQAICTTLHANQMYTNTHIRLTLTRGPKITSSMNPMFNQFGCCLIILPEWKMIGDITTYNNQQGIRLITAANRRNPPQCIDSKIHHNNLINNSKL